MSQLTSKTEKAAIQMVACCLKYFDRLAILQMTADDAVSARAAENQIKSILETNGYYPVYIEGKGTVIKKLKS